MADDKKRAGAKYSQEEPSEKGAKKGSNLSTVDGTPQQPDPTRSHKKEQE
jgi:hypothetical protein